MNGTIVGRQEQRVMKLIWIT